MKQTWIVCGGVCVLSLSACATGRRDGLPSWVHAPELGIVYSFASYANTERGARDLASSDALQLARGPATLLTIDSASTWQPGGDFGLTLSYDITRFLTVESNYFDNGGGGFALLEGATVFVNGTATQNGAVKDFFSQADIATQMYGVALLGYWPVWRGLNVMARAGIEHTRTTVANHLEAGLLGCTTTDAFGHAVKTFCGGAEHHDSSFGAARNVPQFGAGLAYRWNDVKAAIEYQRTVNVGNTQTGRYTVNALNFEVSGPVPKLFGR